MPKSGPAWSSCNRLIAERMENSRHDKHLRALEGTRGMVDSSAPKDHTHLKSKPKTRKLQEDRAAEIQLENRILLQKMLNIDTKPSQIAAESSTRDRVQPRSLHGESQRRELDRITGENQDLLKRLQNAKASVDPRGWEDEEVDRQALKYRLSQNSCRGRAPKLRMPERPPVSDRLPRIGGMAYGSDDWAALSNAELDGRLRQLERGALGPPPPAPASIGNGP
mmetsp:Transcript_48380/g.149456  ORF Transcript_48380/g.149456 Transcript_48380/m.149456 type:complete len:223 (+) Transcript_48380:142-810(+)|eukprot:CAMPEP_0204602130 /NCGR_PEP_ID=MMETSP0661-20131031/56466_1 /ASSEMBLY_ACC=CAM_ASM_000606 /TAXON_ID=109239 /ORGANISM="Alexandrium margalefi, Strain AMGDE01CS-322" /LENGTH=222 /DNA_ID=CAMNT_0051613065 /DNA_START=136 /DNA_END=804 /DNA_ORIENTATION=+